jgi:hypothetical protein
MDRQRLTLVAPFSSDPAAWLHLEYRNRFDGTVVPTTTRPDGLPGAVRIKTYGDVIALYLRHPEVKSGDADGQPCGRATVGVLSRLHVRASRVRHIGKESNRLEEVEGDNSGRTTIQCRSTSTSGRAFHTVSVSATVYAIVCRSSHHCIGLLCQTAVLGRLATGRLSSCA